MSSLLSWWFSGLATMFIGLLVTVVWMFLAKLFMSTVMFGEWYPCYNSLSFGQTLRYMLILGTILFITGVVVYFTRA